MDEEQRLARIAHAGEKVATMKRRDDRHDYTSEGFYMVTMVVEGRRPLLGRVVGRSEAVEGSADEPHVQLTELGDEVRRAWWNISAYYPQVAVVALQLMPDHLHGILYFREGGGPHLGQVIRGFKAGCNRAYRKLFPEGEGVAAATMSQPTSEGQIQTTAAGIPAAFPARTKEGQLQATAAGIPAAGSVCSDRPSSYAATSSRLSSGRGKGKAALLWEAGYNDRILRNYSTLDKWKAYLRDNPRRLLMKREHPDLFRVVRNLHYAGLTFSAQGNWFLLDRPLKVQVQCSRSITDVDLQQQIRQALALGAQGAVFVSPIISKGEKAVMAAVFAAGYPVIYLPKNGLSDMAKPGGQRFDACARGQLLILAPWEHHNERETITRGECLSLNEMARLICES